MQFVDVCELTTNPAEAIRKFRNNPVVVTEGNHPEAILMLLNQANPGGEDGGLGLALAVALYQNGAMSLARAARLTDRKTRLG